MEHATLINNSFSGEINWLAGSNLNCDSCGQIWSSTYGDYAGMQDNDYVICSCGEQVCQVGELKTN